MGRVSGSGEGLDASVAEPAVVVGEIARRFDGLEVLGVGEIERGLVDACALQDVDVAAEEREGNRAGGVDAGVFEFAFDVDGDGDEAAGGGFGEIAGPLVDADGADDLLGLGDLVRLRGGNRGCEGGTGDEDAMEGASHDPAKQFRRYLGEIVLPARSSRLGEGFRLVFGLWNWVRRCWM